MHYYNMRSVDCNGEQCVISDRLHNHYKTFGLLLSQLALPSPFTGHTDFVQMFLKKFLPNYKNFNIYGI